MRLGAALGRLLVWQSTHYNIRLPTVRDLPVAAAATTAVGGRAFVVGPSNAPPLFATTTSGHIKSRPLSNLVAAAAAAATTTTTSACLYSSASSSSFGKEEEKEYQPPQELSGAVGKSNKNNHNMKHKAITRKMIQFNHAGASPSTPAVIECIQNYASLERNIGGYAAAASVKDEIDQVYQDIANLIGATNSEEIALTESATVAWTRIFYTMVRDIEKRGVPRGQTVEKEEERSTKKKKKVILISEAEYAANVVAICQWAKDHSSDWMVLGIPSSEHDDDDGGTSTGIVDLNILDKMLEGKYEYKQSTGGVYSNQVLDPSQIVLVCITHIPTNSGIVNPVEEIGQRIVDVNNRRDDDDNGIYYLVDACQSVGQLSIDVNTIHCDALVATGRKYLRGPRGTGFLYVKSEVCSHLVPSHIDHYGVPITKVPTEYNDGGGCCLESILEFEPIPNSAKRFEFWESNIGNRLGLGIAIQEAMKLGSQNIQDSITQISQEFCHRLATIPTIRIHHHQSTTCGIVTFYSTKLDSAQIVQTLYQEGYCCSVVPAT